MVSVTDNIIKFIATYFHISLFTLIKLIVLFLIFTIVIATVTLIERKVLSLLQRRVGPNYIGYKGRLQFIADALKLLLKHIAIINKTSRLFFIAIPALILIVSYLFWANLVWMPNLAICEIEYNIIFLAIISSILSYLLVLVGYASNNKYAAMSSTRVLIISLNLEILLNFMLLSLGMIVDGLSFEHLVEFQTSWKLHVLLFLPILPIIIITFLLETSRIPFDLTEAESELIAGYTTEYGGFYFALFYLAEYFHLFTFSAVCVICFFGGWE